MIWVLGTRCALIALLAAPALAGTVSYTGAFATDDQVQLPPFTVVTDSTVTFQSHGVRRRDEHGEPDTIVASEISNNTFTIATDKPNVKVSWQVTGIRQDAWAKAYRIPVEVDKPAAEKGRYLHPQLFGAGKEAQIERRPVPKARNER